MSVIDDVKALLTDGVDDFWAIRNKEILDRLYEHFGMVRMNDGITQAEDKGWLESFDSVEKDDSIEEEEDEDYLYGYYAALDYIESEE